jgi:hypothetical protein
MNPAEFKTISESLGLTAQWLADRFAVNLRTVQYWQSGERANPPDDVCLELLELDRQINEAVERAYQAVIELKKSRGLPEEVVLYRFREEVKLWKHHPEMDSLPLTCHSALLARLRRKLLQKKINVAIDYFQ